MKLPLMVFLLALPLASGVGAQDISDCPEKHVCIVHGPDTIAIDPTQGILQSVIVAEQDTTIRDFGGELTSYKVTVATYLSNGDTYDLIDERTVDQKGPFANADLGDVFVLMEAS